MKLKRIARPFELKSVTDEGTFAGYGSVFGNEDSYGDVVEPGAFAETLKTWAKKGGLPPMLWQHRHDEPIGIYEKMFEDDHGLYVEGRLLIDDDPLAKRAHAHMKAGSIGGLSIGYSIPKGGGTWDDEAGVYRLSQIRLWELSVVTFPANEEATIDTVKALDFIETERDFEMFLRDAGLSRADAKAAAGHGWKGVQARRDVGSDDALEVQQFRDLLKTIKGGS